MGHQHTDTIPLSSSIRSALSSWFCLAALSLSNVLKFSMLLNCYWGSLSWFWPKAMSAKPRKVWTFSSFSWTSWPPGTFCLLVEIWTVHLKQCDTRTGICFPLFLFHSFDYVLNFLYFVCQRVSSSSSPLFFACCLLALVTIYIVFLNRKAFMQYLYFLTS